eukprot:2402-Heterococcus_DN1.PRE.1
MEGDPPEAYQELRLKAGAMPPYDILAQTLQGQLSYCTTAPQGHAGAACSHQSGQHGGRSACRSLSQDVRHSPAAGQRGVSHVAQSQPARPAVRRALSCCCFSP